REALALGEATGTSAEETLDMLGGTGLAFIAGMKGPFVRGERTTEGGDFTANAIAKDARLMIDTVAGTTGDAASDDAGPRPGADLPALRGALASLEAEIAAGHGEDDFSTILLEEAERAGEGPRWPAPPAPGAGRTSCRWRGLGLPQRSSPRRGQEVRRRVRGAGVSAQVREHAGGGLSAGEQAAAEEGALEGVVPVHPAAAEAA